MCLFILEGNGPLPTLKTLDPDYKKTIFQLHTSAVQEAVQYSTPNPILGYIPPEIDPSELTLPRHYRTILSLLRSVNCPQLQGYLHSIDATSYIQLLVI